MRWAAALDSYTGDAEDKLGLGIFTSNVCTQAAPIWIPPDGQATVTGGEGEKNKLLSFAYCGVCDVVCSRAASGTATSSQ